MGPLLAASTRKVLQTELGDAVDSLGFVRGIKNKGGFGVFTAVATLVGLLAFGDIAQAQQSKNDTSFKVALTFYQFFSRFDTERPRGAAFFLGERIKSFGEAGFFGERVSPTDELENFNLGGVQVSPYLIEASWGSILWLNKLGYGTYLGENQITTATGLKLETGNLVHIVTELMHTFPVTPGKMNYPSVWSLGIGIHW